MPAGCNCAIQLYGTVRFRLLINIGIHLGGSKVQVIQYAQTLKVFKTNKFKRKLIPELVEHTGLRSQEGFVSD